MTASKGLRHILRFGIHAERDYFIDGRTLYSEVVFNATSVEYTAKSVASFLVGPLSGTHYFIDPNTHAFGQAVKHVQNPGKTKNDPPKTKKSILGLAKYYGSPVSDFVGERPIGVSDFRDTSIKERFVSRVLQFQQERLAETLVDDAKYLEGAGLRPPMFLVAPYLYVDGPRFRDLLKLNVSLAEIAVKSGQPNEIYAELVVGPGLLTDPIAFGEIVGAYTGIRGISGLLLWLSDFPEHEQPAARLQAYKRLVSALAANGRPLVNLYGGYYSILLSYFGLSGVCHGPGYGENRDVVPVGGGPPVLKFYLTPVHQRRHYEELEFYRLGGAWESPDSYFRQVCSGAICKAVIANDLSNLRLFGATEPRKNDEGLIYSSITPEARYRLTMHFLEAKAAEFESVQRNSLDELRGQLRISKKKYERTVPSILFPHLETWAESLSSH